MGNELTPLFLIIKKKYFEEIKNESKKEEYRLITPYWTNRLINKKYSHIIFQNGYNKTSPRICVEFLGIDVKNIRHEFFGNENICVFAIKLGKIITN